MTTKIEFIIDNLEDAAAFEAALPTILEQARALPGIRGVESSRVWPKEDGSATPAYRTLTLAFDGYDEASAAATSPEAGPLFGSLFGTTDGKVTGLFLDVEEA